MLEVVAEGTDRIPTSYLAGLYFPNGIKLRENEEEILVVETITARVLEIDLKTKKVGIFIDNLPGMYLNTAVLRYHVLSMY